ncbi:MAG: tRNA preQ1(34) S-adenosylmethionine ribosyltransferase-isomerase QueA [Gammaproteobacteria bacterium]|nr:tRNA preQ1(34) S-adenosylmethionine ribosyltransferase-isomerase QueA [Gammaproteobacteria bacterium]
MHLDATSGEIQHLNFKQLPDLINADDLMVFNNTRVIAARFFGQKATGGRVEILLERVISDNEALAQVRASKTPKPGSTIQLDDGGPVVQVLDREGEFFHLAFPREVFAIARDFGHVPLPPYIERDDETVDLERYQTVYAREEGAVAAPTAGLHFDNEILEALKSKGVSSSEVTLHVGAGTFQPVRVDEVEDHVMHKEYIDVPESVCADVMSCKARGGRVVAVGTTSVRSLETAAQSCKQSCEQSCEQSGEIEPYQGDTDIFIYPGYEFQCVDAMLTNFHLPGSTLLMLVSAFAGVGNIQRAYAEAIDASYRFFSYGDAMLITRDLSP